MASAPCGLVRPEFDANTRIIWPLAPLWLQTPKSTVMRDDSRIALTLTLATVAWVELMWVIWLAA